jgi:hypothetical protein
MGGTCSSVGGEERRGVYRVLVWKPEGKRPLGRPRLRWEDNIKADLQEVGCGGIDWIELTQDRDRWKELVNVVMNLSAQRCLTSFLLGNLFLEPCISLIYA